MITDLVGFHSKYCPWGKVASEAVVSCLKILFAFLFFSIYCILSCIIYFIHRSLSRDKDFST